MCSYLCNVGSKDEGCCFNSLCSLAAVEEIKGCPDLKNEVKADKCFDTQRFLEESANSMSFWWTLDFFHFVCNSKCVTCKFLTCKFVTCKFVTCKCVTCKCVTCKSVTCKFITCKLITCKFVACKDITVLVRPLLVRITNLLTWKNHTSTHS